MTAIDLVIEEATKAGVHLLRGEIEHVIWSMTGFPAFWNILSDGETPQDCFRKQVKEACSKIALRGFSEVAAEYEREMIRQSNIEL